MNKGTSLLILGLVVGALVGFFYHDYKYDLQLEAGRNWEAGQYLDTIVYSDVTEKVEVVCLKGNAKTFSAKDIEINKGGFFDSFFGAVGLGSQKMKLYFTDKDFDDKGKYTGEKNFLLQKLCEIPKQTDKELDEWVNKTDSGKDVPPDPYFEVRLLNNGNASSLQDCLNKLKDPIGIGDGVDVEAQQRQECFSKFPSENPNNPRGI